MAERRCFQRILTPAESVREHPEAGAQDPVLRVVVDKRAIDRPDDEATNCKAICQPKVPRRGTMEARSPQPCFPHNPPSWTYFSRDDRVFGARRIFRMRRSAILTRPISLGPAAEGGFARKTPASAAHRIRILLPSDK